MRVEVLRLFLSLRNGPLYFISWKFYFFPRGNLREVLFCGQKSLALLLLVAAVAANEEVEADLGIFLKKVLHFMGKLSHFELPRRTRRLRRWPPTWRGCPPSPRNPSCRQSLPRRGSPQSGC